jgi:methionine-rich copper-binding protein CopC
MKRLLTSTLIVIGLLLLQTPHVFGHAQTSNSFPRNNAVLETMPSKVWFEFDGNLTEIDGTKINTLVVKDESGRQLQNSPALVAGARIIATIKDLSASGKITAYYRVVSEDGHPVEGSIVFTVNGASTNTANPSSGSTKKPTPSAADATQIRTAEESSLQTQSAVAVDEHVNHNFFQVHTTHFIQFTVGFGVIGLWVIYDRRRKK